MKLLRNTPQHTSFLKMTASPTKLAMKNAQKQQTGKTRCRIFDNFATTSNQAVD
jgi:hypothetical protein